MTLTFENEFTFAITYNKFRKKDELKELVRGSVEETLNDLLEKEALELTKAAKYERMAERQGYRSGHYTRNLITTSGDMELKVPKRRRSLSGIAAARQRRGSADRNVPQGHASRYLAGVSVRRWRILRKPYGAARYRRPRSAN